MSLRINTNIPAMTALRNLGLAEGQFAKSIERLGSGFQIEVTDTTRVKDIMTPIVFAVPPTCPVANLIEEFLARKVHRLFVVDDDGSLVGVISALDVLRQLRGDDA